MRALASLASAAVLALAPRLAEACPYCASQGGGSLARGMLIGGMILTPFLAAGVVVPLIIRMARRSDSDAEE
jgi:hypothetical protein